MYECGKCGYESTSSDPCQCDWESMLGAAWRLGIEAREQAGENVLDAPLSGEWAGDWTPRALAEQIGLDFAEGELVSELCQQFEDGYFNADAER